VVFAGLADGLYCHLLSGHWEVTRTTLVKLHACKYPEVKRKPDIGADQ
jgi:hypothetical protein